MRRHCWSVRSRSWPPIHELWTVQGAAEAHDSGPQRGRPRRWSVDRQRNPNGSRAAAREEEAQRLLLATLDSSGGLRERRIRGASSTGVISPELHDELIAGGMTRSEVNQLEREVRSKPGLTARSSPRCAGASPSIHSMRKG